MIKIKTHFNLFKQEFISLKQKTHSLSLQLELLNEITDRRSIAKYLIFFNLPVHTSGDINRLFNITQLNNILNNIGLNIQMVKIHHLGKSINNPYPLKIILYDVKTLLS